MKYLPDDILSKVYLSMDWKLTIKPGDVKKCQRYLTVSLLTEVVM